MGEKETQQGKFPIKVPDVLDRTITRLLEGLAGIVSSKREELALSIGHIILQRLTAGRFLEAFSKEWKDYREKGRIENDYEPTEQCRSCLQELLDFLDKDLPDEQTLNVLKQICLVAATEEASTRDGHLPLQYMQIARKLTAGEVIVLNTTYRLAKQGLSLTGSGGIINADRWLGEIAEHSGFTHKELVEMHEAELIKKHLLTDRKRNDRSEAYLGPSKSRLTSLGQGISEYIDHYNELEDELETESS